MNEYYAAVKQLLQQLSNKFVLLKQQNFVVMPSPSDICDSLEIALLHRVASENNLATVQEWTKQCEALSVQIKSPGNSIDPIEKMLIAHKIRFYVRKVEAPSIEKTHQNQKAVLHQKPRREHQEIHIESRQLPLTPKDKNDLLAAGYTDHELNSYLQLGATSLVLRKLANSKLLLNKEESIACIKSCIDMGEVNVSRASGKEVVVFFGDSGTGKSTAINFLHGCTMVKEAGVIKVDTKSIIPEMMPIGHTMHSKTFIPQIMFSDRTDILFCDPPGFIDNRGPEINISNSVNIKRVLRAASSLKFVLLITYDAIYNDRGRAIAELRKTLTNIFGEGNSFQKLSQCILIGISRVPANIDGVAVTIQALREKLFASGDLPKELKSQTYIIDPLDRKYPNYALSRIEWIKAIKQLKAIQTSSQVFNTTLNASDKLFLIAMSNDISQKIEQYLELGQFKAATQYLSLLASLRVVEHPVLEAHFKDNVLNLSRYVALQEQKVLDLSDQADFNLAEIKLNEMKSLISAFQKDFPEFIFQIANIDQYLYSKKLERQLAEIFCALNTFSMQYYQAAKETLLCQAIIERIDSNRNAHKDDLSFVIAILAKFLNLPIINLSANMLLAKITDFNTKYPEYASAPLFLQCLQHSSQEIEQVRAHAKRVYEDLIYETKAQLKIYICESISAVVDKIIKQAPANQFLNSLAPLNDKSQYSHIQKLLIQLAEEKNITAHVKLLDLSLKSLSKICQAHVDQVCIDAQLQFILTRLLDLKDNLEATQKKYQQEQQAQRERQAELQQKSAQEKNLLQQQAAKLQQVQGQIKSQKEAMAKEAEREKHAKLQLRSQLRKTAEQAQKEAQRDRYMQQQSQAQILAEVRNKLTRAMAEDAARRKLEQQRAIEEKQAEIARKRQELENLKQRKIEMAKKREQMQQEQQRLQKLREEKIKQVAQVRAQTAQRNLQRQAQQQARRPKPRPSRQPSGNAQALRSILMQSGQARMQIKNQIKATRQQLMNINAQLNPQLLRQQHVGKLNFQAGIPPTQNLVNFEKQVLAILVQARAKPQILQAQQNRIMLAERAHMSMVNSIAKVAHACTQFNQRAAHHAQHEATSAVAHSFNDYPDLDSMPDNVDYSDQIDLNSIDDSAHVDSATDQTDQQDISHHDDVAEPADNHDEHTSIDDSAADIESSAAFAAEDHEIQDVGQHIDNAIEEASSINKEMHHIDNHTDELEQDLARLSAEEEHASLEYNDTKDNAISSHDPLEQSADQITSNDDQSFPVPGDHEFTDPIGQDDKSGNFAYPDNNDNQQPASDVDSSDIAHHDKDHEGTNDDSRVDPQANDDAHHDQNNDHLGEQAGLDADSSDVAHHDKGHEGINDDSRVDPQANNDAHHDQNNDHLGEQAGLDADSSDLAHHDKDHEGINDDSRVDPQANNDAHHDQNNDHLGEQAGLDADSSDLAHHDKDHEGINNNSRLDPQANDAVHHDQNNDHLGEQAGLDVGSSDPAHHEKEHEHINDDSRVDPQVDSIAQQPADEAHGHVNEFSHLSSAESQDAATPIAGNDDNHHSGGLFGAMQEVVEEGVGAVKEGVHEVAEKVSQGYEEAKEWVHDKVQEKIDEKLEHLPEKIVDSVAEFAGVSEYNRERLQDATNFMFKQPEKAERVFEAAEHIVSGNDEAAQAAVQAVENDCNDTADQAYDNADRALRP
jgi:hypothetical protein